MKASKWLYRLWGSTTLSHHQFIPVPMAPDNSGTHRISWNPTNPGSRGQGFGGPGKVDSGLPSQHRFAVLQQAGDLVREHLFEVHIKTFPPIDVELCDVDFGQ